LTAKQSLELLQQTYNKHVFSTFQQQQLRNSFHFLQSLYFKKIKQYRSSTGNEEGERRLVKIILQDVEGNRDNDQCLEDSERYKEDGGRNKYNNYGDGGNDSNS